MAAEKGAKTAVVWLLFTLPLSLLEVSMAVEKGAKTAVVWLLFTLPLSLLEGGVLSERPAAVKGAPALRGEANPSQRGPF